MFKKWMRSVSASRQVDHSFSIELAQLDQHVRPYHLHLVYVVYAGVAVPWEVVYVGLDHHLDASYALSQQLVVVVAHLVR